jgi:hypothetical protein
MDELRARAYLDLLLNKDSRPCQDGTAAPATRPAGAAAGGRTCLCNGGPKCRHDHRLKQHPRWKVDQLPGGTFRWTTPAGRTYTTEPTRYPI